MTRRIPIPAKPTAALLAVATTCALCSCGEPGYARDQTPGQVIPPAGQVPELPASYFPPPPTSETPKETPTVTVAPPETTPPQTVTQFVPPPEPEPEPGIQDLIPIPLPF